LGDFVPIMVQFGKLLQVRRKGEKKKKKKRGARAPISSSLPLGSSKLSSSR